MARSSSTCEGPWPPPYIRERQNSGFLPSLLAFPSCLTTVLKITGSLTLPGERSLPFSLTPPSGFSPLCSPSQGLQQPSISSVVTVCALSLSSWAFQQYLFLFNDSLSSLVFPFPLYLPHLHPSPPSSASRYLSA